MKIIEKVLFLFMVVGMALRCLLIPGGAFLTALSLVSLQLLYLLFSFALLNDITFTQIFKRSSYKETSSSQIVATICTGVVLMFGINGVLFAFLSWPGDSLVLAAGILFCLIVFIAVLIPHISHPKHHYRAILQRIVLFGSMCIILLAIPHFKFKKFLFRNNQAYVKALEELEKNPGDPQLREEEARAFRNIWKH